jgi:hypothetical protein
MCSAEKLFITPDQAFKEHVTAPFEVLKGDRSFGDFYREDTAIGRALAPDPLPAFETPTYATPKSNAVSKITGSKKGRTKLGQIKSTAAGLTIQPLESGLQI